MFRYFSIVILMVLILGNINIAHAQTPGWSWMQQLADDSQSVSEMNITVDSAGNTITACAIEGVCMMGSQVFYSFNGLGVTSYLWKQDPEGNTIWAKQIEAPNTQVMYVGNDSAGNVYFAARYWGTFTLAGSTLSSPYSDMFIAKLDPDGNYVWINAAGGCDLCTGFSVGADGSCFLTGWISDSATFGETTLLCIDYRDMYIAKMSSSGVWQWARQASGYRNVKGLYVAAGNTGECYVAGKADNDVNFGAVTLPQMGVSTFVAKYDAAGTCLWAGAGWYDDIYGLVQDGLGSAYLLYEDEVGESGDFSIGIRKFNSTGSNINVFSITQQTDVRSRSLAIDSARNLYILGYHYEPLSIGAYNFEQELGTVLIKLNSTGTVIWAYDPSPGLQSYYIKIAVSSDEIPYLLLSSHPPYPVGSFQTNLYHNAVYIAGLSSNGTVNWLRSPWLNLIGSSGVDIDQDSGGFNYVCGNFEGDTYKDDFYLANRGTSGTDIFVAKLANSGTWLWTNCAGSSGNDKVAAIVADNNQNSYVTGSFTDTMHFGDLTITSIGDTDIFLAKLDAMGNWEWATALGGGGSDAGTGLAVDANGNLYLTGFYSGSTDFGVETLTSAGGTDLFVLKLSNTGVPLAVVTGGSTGDDAGTGVAIGANGQIAVCGGYRSAASFGDSLLSSVGMQDILVARLDENLNWLALASAGGAEADSASGIGLDSIGNCYVSGSIRSTASFGTQIRHSLGSSDIFAACLNTQNSWQWALSGGGASADHASGIAVTAGGISYLTGYMVGVVSFGSLHCNPWGGIDIFCAAVNPDGTWQWAKSTGSLESQSIIDPDLDDWGSGITINNGGNCSVTGRIAGNSYFGPTYHQCFGRNETFVGTLIDGVGNSDPEMLPLPDMDIASYPNPFPEKASVQITLQTQAVVKVQVFNVRGQLLTTLLDKPLPKGNSSVEWNGRDKQQQICGSGVYILKASAGGKSKTIKVLKL